VPNELNDPEDDAIVMVPVPHRHLAAVYDLLGRLMKIAKDSPNAETVVVDDANGPWTEAMVETLKTELQSTTLATVLDVLAVMAPEAVSFEDLTATLPIQIAQLRAELATLTKIDRRLFDGRRTWPMSLVSVGDGTSAYRMPQRLAEWWLDAGLILNKPSASLIAFIKTSDDPRALQLTNGREFPRVHVQVTGDNSVRNLRVMLLRDFRRLSVPHVPVENPVSLEPGETFEAQFLNPHDRDFDIRVIARWVDPQGPKAQMFRLNLGIQHPQVVI
jgi:hypothetical protein